MESLSSSSTLKISRICSNKSALSVAGASYRLSADSLALRRYGNTHYQINRQMQEVLRLTLVVSLVDALSLCSSTAGGGGMNVL